MAASELREFTRVATAIPTTVSWAHGSLSGSTRDVSLNGVFVHHAPGEAPPPGTATAVVLHLDGREGSVRIVGRGQVVRQDRDGSAIAFSELDGADSYGHLRTLVVLNAPRPEVAEAEISAHIGLRRRGEPEA